jgi:hypothetical protein
MIKIYKPKNSLHIQIQIHRKATKNYEKQGNMTTTKVNKSTIMKSTDSGMDEIPDKSEE